jgi:hypothetical protein
VAEAVEQSTYIVSAWCREVAALIQDDVERVAAGKYHLADLTTSGLRLARVNLRNALESVRRVSDNVALLTDTSTRSAVTPSITHPIRLPDGVAGTIEVSDLIGTDTGRKVPASSLRLDPSSFDEKAPRILRVKITLKGRAGDIPRGRYAGTLEVIVNGAMVAAFPIKFSI